MFSNMVAVKVNCIKMDCYCFTETLGQVLICLKKLNWKPKINFEKGIKLTFNWYNNNKKYYSTLSKKDILNRLGKYD